MKKVLDETRLKVDKLEAIKTELDKENARDQKEISEVCFFVVHWGSLLIPLVHC